MEAINISKKTIEQIKEIMINLENSRSTSFVSLPSLVQIKNLCNAAKTVFYKESTLLENISGNVIVVGDLHGNIDDLFHIMATHKTPSADQKYLFLGDYVDRGENSIETIIYLYCLKILYPDNVFMLRGNHEFRITCSNYGFLDECIERLGQETGKKVFNYLTGVFPYLPLAGVVNNEYFVVHGGVSSHIETLQQIRDINRIEIEDYHDNEIVTDLVWSDPRMLSEGQKTAKSHRGTGEEYSQKKVEEFLSNNNLSLIIRAHEVYEEGYNACFYDDETETPICITIFSASNYCDMGNKGAICVISSDCQLSIEQHSTNCSYDDDYGYEDDLIDYNEELLYAY